MLADRAQGHLRPAELPLGPDTAGRGPRAGPLVFWTNPGIFEPPAGQHCPPYPPRPEAPLPTWPPLPVTRQPGRALCLLPRGLPHTKSRHLVGKWTLRLPPPRACPAVLFGISVPNVDFSMSSGSELGWVTHRSPTKHTRTPLGQAHTNQGVAGQGVVSLGTRGVLLREGQGPPVGKEGTLVIEIGLATS